MRLGERLVCFILLPFYLSLSFIEYIFYSPTGVFSELLYWFELGRRFFWKAEIAVFRVHLGIETLSLLKRAMNDRSGYKSLCSIE